MDLERENMLALEVISHMIKALNAMFETQQYLCGAFFRDLFQSFICKDQNTPASCIRAPLSGKSAAEIEKSPQSSIAFATSDELV